MEILITNDDGIYSEGIFALACALKKIGNITVVAPDTQQSAVGHAITIADPLRVVTARRNGDFFGYAASGTPAGAGRSRRVISVITPSVPSEPTIRPAMS